MALVTVVPSVIISGGSNFTATGAGSVLAAINDSSDSSYVKKNSAIGTQSLVVGFGLTTIGAGEIVKRVRLRTRCSSPTTASKVNAYLGTRVSSSNLYLNGTAIRGVNALGTIVGAWSPSAPDGSAWDQTRITNLRAQITDYVDTTDISSVMDLFIDVDKSTQPTVTASAPSGTVTTTATPDITWAFVDPDNADPQSYYQVKIFTAAQYGAGGFSPDTSTSYWDSGVVGSADSTVTTGASLIAGTYRAYIKVAKAVNSTPYYSAWAFTGFTIALTVPAPSVPTLVAAYSSITAATTITLTGTAPSGFTSQRFECQRSDDGGVTYANIRNGGAITPNGSYVGTVTDYEAPRGITAYYRIRSVGVNSGLDTPSAWSSSQQILVVNDGVWWFKAPLNSAINISGVKVLGKLTENVIEANMVYRPIGRSKPIVLAGAINGFDGDFDLLATSQSEYALVKAVVNYQGTLLVQDSLGAQRYIRITDRNFVKAAYGGIFRVDVKVKFVEVGSA